MPPADRDHAYGAGHLHVAEAQHGARRIDCRKAGGAADFQRVQWLLTWGDVLILLGLVLLFVELLKSTSTGTSAIFNHALSMLVFIICLVEFLLQPAFATSTFFLIMIMSLLDVLAGVIVTIVSARRDVEFDKG